MAAVRVAFLPAIPGTFNLVPARRRIAALRRDYSVMRDMCRAPPMEFERILETLGEVEGCADVVKA